MRYYIIIFVFLISANANAQRYIVVRDVPLFILYEIKDSTVTSLDTLCDVLVKNYCFDGNVLRTVTIMNDDILLENFEIVNGQIVKNDHAILDKNLLKRYKIDNIVSTSFGFYIDRKKGWGYMIPHYKEEYLKRP
jgi:hypothetical protein